jgi:hypothetical protein
MWERATSRSLVPTSQTSLTLFVRALLLSLPYPVPTHESTYVSTLSSNTLQPIDHLIFKADCIF